MKTTPDYIENLTATGGDVRYYQESNGTWRYVCALGEGQGKADLEAAKAEVREMMDASVE